MTPFESKLKELDLTFTQETLIKQYIKDFVIGSDPVFMSRDPQYITKIKSHVIKVKDAQRKRVGGEK